MTTEKRIYLAGPDVFRDNAISWLKLMKERCTQNGFVGLSPFDNEAATPTQIFKGNISLLNECDIVIANLVPFRGPNMDDGTAFEIGYAHALGKRIYGYMIHSELHLKTFTKVLYPEYKMSEFPIIEDFNYPRNLMIVDSIKASGGQIFLTFEDCLDDIKCHS